MIPYMWLTFLGHLYKRSETIMALIAIIIRTAIIILK